MKSRWWTAYRYIIARASSLKFPNIYPVYLNDILAVSQLPISQRCFVLYAEDILIISPSVCNLQQQLVNACEVELALLDMQVNFENLPVCVSGHAAMLNVTILCWHLGWSTQISWSLYCAACQIDVFAGSCQKVSIVHQIQYLARLVEPFPRKWSYSST